MRVVRLARVLTGAHADGPLPAAMAAAVSLPSRGDYARTTRDLANTLGLLCDGPLRGL